MTVTRDLHNGFRATQMKNTILVQQMDGCIFEFITTSTCPYQHGQRQHLL